MWGHYLPHALQNLTGADAGILEGGGGGGGGGKLCYKVGVGLQKGVGAGGGYAPSCGSF